MWRLTGLLSHSTPTPETTEATTAPEIGEDHMYTSYTPCLVSPRNKPSVHFYFSVFTYFYLEETLQGEEMKEAAVRVEQVE